MSDNNYMVSPGPPVDTASGAVAGTGETVSADPDNRHDRRLIETGRLVAVAEPKRRRTTAKSKTAKADAAAATKENA